MADQAAAPKPTSSVKLVLLGEAAVGKSSLVLRFVNDEFQENKEPTIGAAFLTQRLTLPQRTIKFEIWDTAGQERFASLAPMYYRNAQAALVVYDVTKKSSLVKARHWVAELQRQASPGIVVAVVGNKADLVEGESAEVSDVAKPAGEGEAEGEGEGTGTSGEERLRQVSTSEAQAFADEHDLLFFETSAKAGTNVLKAFEKIAEKIPESALKGKPVAGQGAQAGQRAGGGDESRVQLGRSTEQQSKQEGCAC